MRIKRKTRVIATAGLAIAIAGAVPTAAAASTRYVTFAPLGRYVRCTGSYHNVPDGGNFTRAYNNCRVRVWFYQHTNHTGYTHCVSPGRSWAPTRTYKELLISHNTSAC